MLKIAKWFDNYQSPAVLMIDDLSDAYISVYSQQYKNDWGYYCDKEGSSFKYLNDNLLEKFPDIKITFFTPYLRHNVINENSKYGFEKYAVGERNEFVSFLKKLDYLGHEIAHHGSNHGKYVNSKNPSTANHNWIHEWALFDDTEYGIKVTISGKKVFKDNCNIEITGGKYCGYVQRENSQEIIDQCNFLYWCSNPSYNVNSYDESFFGLNKIISFPTTFAGNAFIRLKYLSGDKRRDRKKIFSKYFQNIYNLYAYYKLYKLYNNKQIISIQEHISPSTSAGTVQSANIITDINSLNKIFKFLSHLSIWYATCEEISKYIYTRENSKLNYKKNKLSINFNNKKNISNTYISIISKTSFRLKQGSDIYKSVKKNGLHTISLKLKDGENIFDIL
jgi:hypothetical protein